ncbi:MAG: diacylglycerol kinase family lipid kinase [Candidatus Lokiarchaeota archaeon]|nr:diacylglycerol kinase family lipid kinase [Candidatus Lokiarchaeota archaeon]
MFFVINPKSQNGKTGEKWEKEIKPLLDSNNLKYDFKLTEYRNHATEIVRQKIKDGEKFIIAVGGDGTFNEVLNGFFENDEIIDPDCVLGFFSSGTGSDTIKTLGHSKEISDQIEILKSGIIKKVDVGKACYVDFDGNKVSRYFINVGDVGLSGDVVDRVNRTTKRLGGKISFLIGSIRGILHHKPVQSTFIFDDDENNKFEGNLNLAAFAVGKYFGGGMMICPNAINDDGLLDVVSGIDMGKLRLLKNLKKIYKGEHLDLEGVTEHQRCKKIKIISESPIFVDLDGEQVGTTEAEFEIIPGIVSIKTVEKKESDN